jgi:3D (Asp-Asp-Asp) domain-containing protein
VFILELAGVRLPDGTTHDGWCTVNDTGGAIFGAHFDVFTGVKALAAKVKIPSLAHVWFEGIEQRLPMNYGYGL